ncbi:TPA: isopeptide-forming domain-containing fimbrial protein [Streptococcus pyogenes]|uniref:pilin N-terminal domain-containing protein n=1 Tax=Streptococcus pyogenes TaxID=1314 RepID=UPI000E020FC8|nr:pilin N-terminal domain-containing protein [Streptococcus pyogenes]SUO44233.1 cell wall surface anchor family protein [Streptococcus pyogenes]HEP1429304.1 isopeptide-forming domain-containing fimbrial protein [Streptococcus pyogenes]HEP1646838.1 isopeptide-forming domain-containing fimbrial protein [Streptococcus pyogenes]HEP1757606.1 isopeptide-forming domain-containing fimbrial protein [Streptococcus pyogenes]HEP1765960.1 isopeptide-forming domain-containing fimbrial protein [Streptococcu
MKAKLCNMLVAMLLILGSLLPAATRVVSAANKTTDTVTIHKILMNQDDFNHKEGDKYLFPGTKGRDGTEYVGTNLDSVNKFKAFFGSSATEISDVFFALKFADDYKEPNKKERSDKAGKYVKKDDKSPTTPKWPLEATSDINEAVGDVTTGSGHLKFFTDKLKGNFEFVEIKEKSTYVGKKGETVTGMKAVPLKVTLPLVNKDGVVKDAHVFPKNMEDKPQIDKNFKKGITQKKTEKQTELEPTVGADYNNYAKTKAEVSAQIGDTIPYEVKTKIPQDAEYQTIRWEDTMSKGLTYDKFLTINTNEIKDLTHEDYMLKQDNSGFMLELNSHGLEKVKNAAKNGPVEFTLTYSATVNKDAIADQSDTNQIKFDYSNRPTRYVDPETNTITPGDNKIKVTKNWMNGQDGQDPDGVTVTYYLYEKNGDGYSKVVDNVTLNKAPYSHEFKNLTNNKQYFVKEVVKGYIPEYTPSGGTVTITNKKDNDNPPPLIPTTPDVITGGKKFVKTNDDDAADAERLLGAKFVVKNKDNKYLLIKPSRDSEDSKTKIKTYEEEKRKLEEKITAYNKLSKEDKQKESGKKLHADIIGLQLSYLDTLHDITEQYEWTEKNSATMFMSDIVGRLEVSGLAYDTYRLEEIEAPEGYARLSSDIEFTVNKGSYTGGGLTQIHYNPDAKESGKQDAQQIRNKKIIIPQTGGIGVVIFAVVGAALMATAFVAYRKNNKEVA